MTDNPDLAEAIDILRNWKGIMPGALVDRVNVLIARHPEKPKLDGCPWCGSEPEMSTPQKGYGAMRRGYCHNCQVYGPWGTDEADAAAAWNRRAKPASGSVSGGKPE